MKITKSMYYCESHESEDLYLYIVNDGDLYFEIVSACKTLAKHLKKHEYNSHVQHHYRYIFCTNPHCPHVSVLYHHLSDT